MTSALIRIRFPEATVTELDRLAARLRVTGSIPRARVIRALVALEVNQEARLQRLMDDEMLRRRDAADARSPLRIRFPDDLIRKVDRLRKLVPKSNRHGQISRAAVLRALVRRQLASALGDAEIRGAFTADPVKPGRAKSNGREKAKTPRAGATSTPVSPP